MFTRSELEIIQSKTEAHPRSGLEFTQSRFEVTQSVAHGLVLTQSRLMLTWSRVHAHPKWE